MTHSTPPAAEHEDVQTSATDPGDRSHGSHVQRSPEGQPPADGGTPGPSTVNQDASAAPEEHQLKRAETLAARLERLIAKAPQCIEKIAQTLEGFDALAATVADAAEAPIRKIETACTRADTLEKRLSAAADRLLEQGESSQHKIELLLNGLGAGETLQGRLQECNGQLRSLAEESQKTAATQAERLRELAAEAEARMSALDERVRHTTQEATDTIARQAQAAAAEGMERANHQKTQLLAMADQHVERARALSAELEARAAKSDEMIGQHVREVTDTFEARAAKFSGEFAAFEQASARHMETLGTAVRASIDQYLSTSLARYQEEIGSAFEARLAAAAKTLEACTGKAEELHRDLAEADQQRRALEKRMTDAAAIVSAAEESARLLRDHAADHGAALETARRLEEAVEAARTQTTRLAEHGAAVADLDQKVAQATQAAAEVAAAGQKLRKDAGSLIKFGETALARHRRTLAEVLEETKRTDESLATRLADAGRMSEQLAAAVQAATDHTQQLAGTQTRLEELSAGAKSTCLASVKAANATAERVRRDMTTLIQDAEKTALRRQEALAESITAAKSSTQEIHGLTDAARQTAAQLSSAVQAGGELHTKLTQASDQVTGLLDSVRSRSETLATLSVTAKQAAVAAETATRKLQQEVGAIIKAGDEATAEQRTSVEATARQAQSLVETFNRQVAAAEEEGTRLVTRTHAAVEAEGALSRITAAAHDMRERIGHADTLLNDHLARGTALAGTLAETCVRAEGVQKQVDELHTTAAAIIGGGEASLARQYNVLFAALDDARNRTDELRAAIAAAGHHRDQIAEHCRAAGVEADAAMAGAATAAARAESLLQQVSAVTSETEQRTRELAAEAQRAGTLLEQLEPAKAELESLQQMVDGHTAGARDLVEQLRAQVGGGQEAAARLQALQTECTQAVDHLAGQCAGAKSIAERVSKVAADLQVSHDGLAANRELLNDLGRQCEGLWDMVRQAQVTTDALRVQLTSLLTEPQTIVCDAKQQALQLTGVCRAVKKVFSGLSKSTLVATEKIDKLSRVQSDVTQTAQTLQQWVTEAAKTLQQWVTEAAHVQKRLEATMQMTPSISETHSPQRLYSLGGLPTRGAPPAPARGAREPERQAPPAPEAAKPAPRVAPSRRISPEEVARLIADAKRQQEREQQPAAAR